MTQQEIEAGLAEEKTIEVESVYCPEYDVCVSLEQEGKARTIARVNIDKPRFEGIVETARWVD